MNPELTNGGQEPLSEVGCEGLASEENSYARSSVPASEPSLSQQMQLFLSRLMAISQPQTSSSASTQLIKFDPDDDEADIEGWCNVTEIIVNDRRLEGAELLL